jgi:hypothetical protein
MEENKEQVNKEVLELRMYFFVPYNISPIQQGIQAGHVALRYVKKYHQDNPQVWDFVDNHETFIILNGGTTNDQIDAEGLSIGGMNQIGNLLHEHQIDFAYFNEPDLNYALTALCFICDERVFNRKKYLDFIDYLSDVKLMRDDLMAFNFMKKLTVTIEEHFSSEYKEWVRLIGGVKNVFLRELIKDKKLA